jgi:hypothetical protein
MDADVTLVLLTALIGLLGVIVGGVLNGVVTAALDRVQSARRAQVVARLVQDDLTYMTAVMEAEMAEGVWKRLTPEAPSVPFDSWREGRDVLAAHLTFAEWAVASVAARQALLVVQRAPLNPKSGKPITSGEKAVMATMVPDLSQGIDVLQPLSHGQRVPTFWRALFRAS